MDQHNDGTGDKFVKLELKLTEFIDKLNCVSAEMEKIKKQQHDLIALVKQTLIKKNESSRR